MTYGRFSMIRFLALGIVFLSLLLSGCPSTPAPSKVQAQADIGAIQVGATTIFRVTVNSVTDLEGASSFNLLGAETTSPTALGSQLENYVVTQTAITLGIYNASGTMIAYTTLDANDYPDQFSGSIDLSKGSTNAIYSSSYSHGLPPAAIRPQQASQLDILARGLIDPLTNGSRSNVEIPLYCGQTGGTFTPDPADGYFIINDVAIEFNYAFNNRQAFNDVLTIKFIESGRSFDNMQLYFKLPGAGRPLVDARTGQVVPAANVQQILNAVQTFATQANPFSPAKAIVDLTITPFGPAKLVETTVTDVMGDCVLGAKSFYVIETQETPDPDAIKAIGDRFDKNTLEPSLVLLILGDEVEVRDRDLNACDVWSPSQSGGFGTTVDNWDIGTIPAGATFDIRFNAYSVPDKFIVEYPAGTVRLDTGWRGSSSYEGNPLYPGGIAGPGSGQVDDMFSRGTVNSIKVTVIGPEQGTAWDYSLRCRTP